MKAKKESKPTPHFPAPEWMGVSSSLAASLAHEIRNPLLSIKGAAQLLEQVVSEEDKSLAALIITEASRIEKLIATMDPLTPNPSHEMLPLNIHEVTEYVRLAASSFAPAVRILTHYDPSLPEIRGVREALIQALMNLVKNAVEAVLQQVEAVKVSDGGAAGGALSPCGRGLGEGAGSSTESSPHAPPSNLPPQGGKASPAAPLAPNCHPTLTLTTRYLAGERMQRPDGARLNLQISVTDNGPGVAADVVPRLFTPFNSSKPEGKGLGLAITAKIIEEHGGLIAYDAPAEGGARFSIYLPVH
jgi:two-component system nitrogen regulation sensor histidine kinase GlnL